LEQHPFKPVIMRYLFLILFCFSFFSYVTGQGCSDAGFCSLGTLKNLPARQNGKNSIDIGSSFGIGEQKTFTVNPYLQYSRQVSDGLQLTAKITGTYASGFLGNATDGGDAYGYATIKLKKKNNSQVRLLAGFKIPMTAANDKNAQGKPLPLDYQSSIGTYDLILGANYLLHERFELDAGVQAPVIQANRNSFFPDEYADPRAKEFTPTNQFERRPDALLRVGYYIPVSKTLMIRPNVLGIYHLGEDSYLNRFGVRTTILNSSGLTLNAGIVVSKQFANSTNLEFITAAPFVVRDVRPDGLTRAFAFSIQYAISF
jgi:hypothetical protein